VADFEPAREKPALNNAGSNALHLLETGDSEIIALWKNCGCSSCQRISYSKHPVRWIVRNVSACDNREHATMAATVTTEYCGAFHEPYERFEKACPW